MSGEETVPPRGSIAVTFVAGQVRRDEAFDELDDRIRRIVRFSPGYRGRKDWRDCGGHRAVTDYWKSLEG